MQLLLKLFKSAPFLPEITDNEEVKAKYKYWRIRIMYSMFTGYVLYYLTRKSFTFAMPGIVEELHLDKGELGIMGSAFALIYGLSKFFSGVLSDQSNPRYFMAFGLIVTGILNIFMGFSSALWMFVLVWALNGWFQGFGWPPCVKLLSHWYSHSERGSWWSSWAVSQNVGGFLTPWFVGICFAALGWRFAMIAPGVVCIFGGLFLLNRLADVPQTLGLPPIEKFRNDYPEKKAPEEESQKLSSKEIIISVLKNKYIWMLAIAYFFIYFVRAGMGDWTAFYMMEAKGYSRLTASGCVSLVEAGGFLGMLSAGWLSD
ncbi:MAG: MFS transporter, partial [Chlamydiae bacterium]|nr:MFS transporter [Chlamydiota bacterium]